MRHTKVINILKKIALVTMFLHFFALSLIGEIVNINFDDYPAGTIITSQYSDRGVIFSASKTWVGLNEASSLPNFLIGMPNSFAPISMDFLKPADLVTAKLISVGDAVVTAYAYAIGLDGELKDAVSVTNPGSGVGLGNQNLITLRGPGITRVLFVITQNFPGDGFGIDDLQIVFSESLISVCCVPPRLWLDDSGRGSGVVFRATTTAARNVDFKVQTPFGAIIPIGASSAVQQGAEYVAKLSWWGQTGLPEGTYTIVATAGSSSKSSTFEVKHSAVSLTGLGKWMKESKDPSAVLPPFAAAEVCPLNS